MNKVTWKKYTFEFLSIFIAVVSAFALNNWNDVRNAKISEEKILTEIKNGIDLDLQDFEGNVRNHNLSLNANKLFRNLIHNKAVDQENIQRDYILLFRDFTPIINLSGYESLKASGLKIIRNDSLRFQIIALYDFYYNIMEKLENEINEMQSYPNYFKPVNDLLHPFMIFNDQGDFLGFEKDISLSESQKKELESYFWRLESNRNYKLGRYKLVQEKMKELKGNIEKYLN